MLAAPLIDILTPTNLATEISRLIISVSAENRPFAAWKLPESNRIHLIASFSSEAQRYAQTDLEMLPDGFVAAPFHSEEGVYFIPADEHWVWETDMETGIVRRIKGLDVSGQLLQEKFSMQHLKNYLKPALVSASSSENFQTAVKEAIAAIERQEFLKVVLSRQKQVAMPECFQPVETFIELGKHYPNAFVSFFAIPQAGVWMGATPEILVSVDKHEIFRTMALAGTQAKGDLVNLQQATWTQKEIAEQAMVSRYIINCFKKIRLREFEEKGPRTVAAGELIHLRTDFEVDMRATNFPQLGTVMLELLHPTSAVCGMPKQAAMAFIAAHEHHDRALYSGYIGSVNIDSESHLFVNLRCMQLQEKSLILYAGAGITEDSVPEKEWLETEMKCNTMLHLIQPTDIR